MGPVCAGAWQNHHEPLYPCLFSSTGKGPRKWNNSTCIQRAHWLHAARRARDAPAAREEPMRRGRNGAGSGPESRVPPDTPYTPSGKRRNVCRKLWQGLHQFPQVKGELYMNKGTDLLIYASTLVRQRGMAQGQQGEGAGPTCRRTGGRGDPGGRTRRRAGPGATAAGKGCLLRPCSTWTFHPTRTSAHLYRNLCLM